MTAAAAQPGGDQPQGAVPELTIDQLAARAGLTVRNVRAYAARGLLPAPRLRGRTGLYGEEHVRRLQLVREMLSEGFSLHQIEQTLAGAPTGGGAAALALRGALMAPWLPEPPEQTDAATLMARAGQPTDARVIDELVGMGVLERLDGDRLLVLDPSLVAAGLQVIRLGIPPAAVVAAQKQVAELVGRAADAYVQMFHETAWREFAAAGAPPEQWPRMQALLESIQPVAAQALLASFRAAMAEAVRRTLTAALDRGDRP